MFFERKNTLHCFLDCIWNYRWTSGLFFIAYTYLKGEFLEWFVSKLVGQVKYLGLRLNNVSETNRGIYNTLNDDVCRWIAAVIKTSKKNKIKLLQNKIENSKILKIRENVVYKYKKIFFTSLYK